VGLIDSIRPDLNGQVVVGHHIGVEIDLHFGLQVDHLQGGGQVFNKELLGLVQVSDISIAAVTVVAKVSISTSLELLTQPTNRHHH